MKTRKARPADAPAIHALIALYAVEGLLLPREESEIRAHIGRFLVVEEERELAGCVALETYGAGLAEIRSLAVGPEFRGYGLGARLVEFALAEARRRGITRVFAVTQSPEFFLRHGFQASNRAVIPEKTARDCCNCAKLPSCRLVAVVLDLLPEGRALRVLSTPAIPASIA